MATDPEVKIGVSLDAAHVEQEAQEVSASLESIRKTESGGSPPDRDPIVILLNAIVTRAGLALKALGKVGSAVTDVTEAAAGMTDIASRMGDPEVILAVEEAFSKGASAVANYGARHEELAGKLERLAGDARGVVAELEAGNVTYDEALVRLARYVRSAEKAQATVGAFGRSVNKAMEELKDAGALDGILAAWQGLDEELVQTRGAMEGTISTLEEEAHALAKQERALDASASNYERQRAAIQGQVAEVRKYIDKLREQVQALDEVRESAKGVFEWDFGSAAKALDVEREKLRELSLEYAELEGKAELAAQKRAAASERSAEAVKREAAAAAAAAQKEAEAEEANANALRLAAMSKQQLIAETKRLIVERQGAAKVRDVQAYQELTLKLGQCRNAMRALNQEMQLHKMSMMQQAQAGMQVAGALKRLGEQVSSGSTDIAGMTNEVLALGAAFKAGLGPIGWAMMLLEGAQMLAEKFYFGPWRKEQEERKKALEEEVEQFLRLIEVQEEVAAHETVNYFAAMRRDAQELYEEELKHVEEVARAREREVQVVDEGLQKEREALRVKQLELKTEELRINTMAAAGEISEKEAETRIRAAREALQVELDALNEREAAFKNRELVLQVRVSEESAQRAIDEMELKLRPFEDILSVKLPTKEEWDTLQLKIDNELASAAEKVDHEAFERQAEEVRRQLATMGIRLGQGVEPVILFIAELKRTKAEQERITRQLAEKNKKLRQELEASNKNARLMKEAAKLKEGERAALEELVKAQEQAAEDAERRNEEWEALQEKTLPEQRRWLEATIAGLAEGSREAKRYAQELKKVKVREIKEEERRIVGALKEINSKYKTTLNYHEEEKRTRRQILNADKAILKAKLAELRRAREEAVAAGNMKAVAELDEEIKGTRAAIRVWKRTLEANVAQSRKWARELEPPQMQAKSKAAQKQLDALCERYAKLVHMAEEAAEAGKGGKGRLKVIYKQLVVLAKDMDRLSASGEEGSRLLGQTKEELKVVAAASGAWSENVKRSAAAQEGVAGATKEAEKQLGKGAAAAKEAADAHADEAAAAQDAAAAAEKVAKEAERRLLEERQQREESDRLDATLSRLDAAAERLRAQNETISERLNGLAERLNGAADAAQSSAAAVEEAVTATGAVQKAMERVAALVPRVADAAAAAAGVAEDALSALDKSIKDIRKQIDLINRKL